MALALWAAAEHGALAWVTLDRYDNRPEAFWSYVVAALRGSGIVIPEELSADPQQQGTDHVFLLRLVSALAAQDPPVLLVLDDFHVLTEPEVLKGLDFVLRNAGSGLRVVVSSRTDPPLRLHRYRLAGELAEIRASDLAFNLARGRPAHGPAPRFDFSRFTRVPHAADRGLGGGPPPGGDLHGHSSRP